jgi:hypothetical protein
MENFIKITKRSLISSVQILGSMARCFSFIKKLFYMYVTKHFFNLNFQSLYNTRKNMGFVTTLFASKCHLQLPLIIFAFIVFFIF